MQTQSKFRLLIVRLGAMGDILHALPAVTALRRAHPGWIIDWVVESKWSALLSAQGANGRDTGSAQPLQPVVDRLHLTATRDWRQHPLAAITRRAISDLYSAVRAGNYDTVLDLQGAVRSAVIARLSGCRRRIGESDPRERIARWLFTEQVRTTGSHVVEQDVELASAIAGDNLTTIAPLLPFDPSAESWAAATLPEDSTQPPVLLNPGAGWGAKMWPAERYAEVSRSLLSRGMRVFVNAGPGEVLLANDIAQRTGGGAIPLLCSLEQLIAITRRVSLVIGGDTGPIHLASALGRPVVGIYGPTDPSRNGPYGTRARVLRSPQSRRDHTRNAEPEAGLLTITADQVLTAADELLYSGSDS